MPLEMMSQRGSRRNIALVVPEWRVAEAIQRLHARFFAPAVREVLSA